ncbi:MAG: asparaginase domain-containing protein [Anaerolineae bacterium]|nr:asparaginase domain-containing protein [Anaerolineae bacterium]MCO5195178.1 asparaginase domain-containing protein [Anaerolineae bacterium]MCO5197222.1 asparaginase domain-containing protein [Anaerolineae bacterium]
MEIRIITTGGTIDKVYFDALSQFQVGTPEIANMLREANVGFTFVVEPLMQKDSLEMTDEDRQRLYDAVRRSPQNRILVTHGTDTMLDSAEKLSTITDKTIVFTGSLQPARLRSTDAIFNVGFAAAAVQLLPPGAYVAMNGQIFRPGEARKNRARNRFEPL